MTALPALRSRNCLLAGLAVMVLAGCASDPRYAQGLEWVTSTEREKARLQQQGFPQMGTGRVD